MKSLIVGLASLSLAGGVAAAVPADAATKIPCSAHMSNSKPKQNSTTNVLVTTAGSAAVTTVAHFKTTNTTHKATASKSGKASIAYKVARATKGYKIVVSVTVKKGASTATCSTSFTPA